MKTPGNVPIGVVTFASLIMVFVFSECWAIRPYQPVHPDPVLEPWRWRSFLELKGQGLICLIEDRGGAIWFGVDQGVLRYDGVHWTAFTPDDGYRTGRVDFLRACDPGDTRWRPLGGHAEVWFISPQQGHLAPTHCRRRAAQQHNTGSSSSV
jgi:hypothetical protein